MAPHSIANRLWLQGQTVPLMRRPSGGPMSELNTPKEAEWALQEPLFVSHLDLHNNNLCDTLFIVARPGRKSSDRGPGPLMMTPDSARSGRSRSRIGSIGGAVSQPGSRSTSPSSIKSYHTYFEEAGQIPISVSCLWILESMLLDETSTFFLYLPERRSSSLFFIYLWLRLLDGLGDRLEFQEVGARLERPPRTTGLAQLPLRRGTWGPRRRGLLLQSGR